MPRVARWRGDFDRIDRARPVVGIGVDVDVDSAGQCLDDIAVGRCLLGAAALA